MKRNSYHFAFLTLILLLACAGCKKSEPTANTPVAESTATPAKPPATPLTPFERDVQFIKNGRFTYVLVVSRKDGKPLDGEDGKFLRENARQVVDWAMSDPQRAVGGTNFQFTREQMDLLETRFKVENYSN